MLCKEFKSKCRECPLFCDNNFKSLPCWLLDESDIQDIMKDYPYVDVKIRMIFNDIETRLAAVEKKVSESKLEPIFDVDKLRVLGDEIGIFSGSYVDESLYDKLEAKHEADCRLISEYDLEIKKLEKQNIELKDELFDLENVENERDHYKGLYSSQCDDYDNLLAKQIKTKKDFEFYRDAYYKCCSANDDHIEKEHDLKEEVIKLTELKDNYKNLFHSLNHKHQKVVGEMKAWKERAIEAEKPDKLRPVLERENRALREKLKETEEKFNDACVLNKAREDVYYANLKLKKTIEAKDREIDLLRAELDKYKTDDECDDR